MKSQKNYSAWNVSSNVFETSSPRERMLLLVNYAILAPSSHNSQPWKFLLSSDEISILPDLRRSLPRSDANHRQLFISLGCAVENLIIAADYYGLQYNVLFENAPVPVVVRVRIENLASPFDRNADSSHLVFSIPHRRVNRHRYSEFFHDADFVKLIPSLNPRSDIKIYIIDDFSRREAMSEVVLDAMIEAMEDKDFRRELSYYIKPSTTRSPVGMPGSTINIPLPLSYVASTVIRNLNTGRFQRKQDEPLLKKFTPLFIIIATEDDSPEAWIETGRIYERIALESARRNISTHPMAAAIQIGNFYKELQRLLETSYRPQMFFRMGFAKTQPPHSPRLTPTDVCDMKI